MCTQPITHPYLLGSTRWMLRVANVWKFITKSRSLFVFGTQDRFESNLWSPWINTECNKTQIMMPSRRSQFEPLRRKSDANSSHQIPNCTGTDARAKPRDTVTWIIKDPCENKGSMWKTCNSCWITEKCWVERSSGVFRCLNGTLVLCKRSCDATTCQAHRFIFHILAEVLISTLASHYYNRCSSIHQRIQWNVLIKCMHVWVAQHRNLWLQRSEKQKFMLLDVIAHYPPEIPLLPPSALMDWHKSEPLVGRRELWETTAIKISIWILFHTRRLLCKGISVYEVVLWKQTRIYEGANIPNH